MAITFAALTWWTLEGTPPQLAPQVIPLPYPGAAGAGVAVAVPNQRAPATFRLTGPQATCPDAPALVGTVQTIAWNGRSQALLVLSATAADRDCLVDGTPKRWVELSVTGVAA